MKYDTRYNLVQTEAKLQMRIKKIVNGPFKEEIFDIFALKQMTVIISYFQRLKRGGGAGGGAGGGGGGGGQEREVELRKQPV